MPKRSITNSACKTQGFTLIELLVALAVGLLLVLAILVVQVRLAEQNTTINDTYARDNEARGAMDLIGRDLSSNGFLLGAVNLRCPFILNYDSAVATSPMFATFPVAASPAVAGNSIAAIAGTAPTLSYPASGSGIATDVLTISSTTSLSRFSDALSPTVRANPNGAINTLSSGQLPVVSSASLTATDVGLVQVPFYGDRLCIRAPISQLGSASGSAYVQSTGALMPPGAYQDFATQLTSFGVSSSKVLSNAQLHQAKLTDLGAATGGQTAVTNAYYVDTSGAFPMLMRATINAMNDTVIGAPQTIAAGVVSMQVRFGVDTTGTGTVGSYMTWANVVATGNTANVRSVAVGLVIRSLYPDKNVNNTVGSTINPGASFGFQPYIRTASDIHLRFATLHTEMAMRNQLWLR